MLTIQDRLVDRDAVSHSIGSVCSPCQFQTCIPDLRNSPNAAGQELNAFDAESLGAIP